MISQNEKSGTWWVAHFCKTHPQNIFHPTNFYIKSFWDRKIFLNQYISRVKIFFRPRKLSPTNIHGGPTMTYKSLASRSFFEGPSSFLEKNILESKMSFYPKSFFDQTIFGTKILSIGTKSFWTKHF